MLMSSVRAVLQFLDFVGHLLFQTVPIVQKLNLFLSSGRRLGSLV